MVEAEREPDGVDGWELSLCLGSKPIPFERHPTHESHGAVVTPQCCSPASVHDLSSVTVDLGSWLRAVSGFHPPGAGKINIQLTGGQSLACIIMLQTPPPESALALWGGIQVEMTTAEVVKGSVQIGISIAVGMVWFETNHGVCTC